MPGPDAVTGRRLLHRGRKFDFELVEHAGPGGKVFQREVVRHPGSVVILPLLDDGPARQVVMVRNWRAALEKELLELPAGTLEKGEQPEACARRELIEETGYEAATMVRLGHFYTSPGLSDELMTAFLASGLRHVGQRPEEDERLTVAPMPIHQALVAMEWGQLTDAKSMLTLLLARKMGFLGDGGGGG